MLVCGQYNYTVVWQFIAETIALDMYKEFTLAKVLIYGIAAHG